MPHSPGFDKLCQHLLDEGKINLERFKKGLDIDEKKIAERRRQLEVEQLKKEEEEDELDHL